MEPPNFSTLQVCKKRQSNVPRHASSNRKPRHTARLVTPHASIHCTITEKDLCYRDEQCEMLARLAVRSGEKRGMPISMLISIGGVHMILTSNQPATNTACSGSGQRPTDQPSEKGKLSFFLPPSHGTTLRRQI
jgi:hypothetical protein